MELPGFSKQNFTFDGKKRPVFRCGTGPGVIIVHEAPGITPFVARFGQLLAERGFTAVLPSLFGTPGRSSSQGYLRTQLSLVCLSREFRCFSMHRSSPITEWLRALCREVFTQCGGRGVGALGMCVTGNFALSMMLEESVMAPVLSQPSLPLPVTEAHRSSFGISEDELLVVKQRSNNGCKVMGLRFTNDPLCTRERFASLTRALGNGFESIEIDSSPGNPYGIAADAHSVLTSELRMVDGHPTKEAFECVIANFEKRLL